MCIRDSSNREALGAQVVLQCDQGTQLRTLNGGGSYLSTNQALLIFEIPQDWQPQQLTVQWPAGGQEPIPLSAESWRDSPAQFLTIVEPIQN